jgi:predicted phage terminase large subunit-like protein
MGASSPSDAAAFARAIHQLSPHGHAGIRRLLEGHDPVAAQQHFLPFVRTVWPGFIHGSHHDIMAEVFERIEKGELRRAIINLPPRHSKSMFASIYFPSWYLGRHPDRQIMECSHTVSLAQGFGRQVRNLIATPEYRKVFPTISLSKDAKAAGNWSTGQNGRYFAVGTTGAVAGRGADLVIVDDPHSEQDVIENSKSAFERAWSWYLSGPRQRLQPGAAILVVMTRWGELDLTGRLVKYAREGEDHEDWELIQLPAILPSGSSLWPAYWSQQEMLRTKATIPVSRWAGQYMQAPTGETGALIKREWWRDWPLEDPPKCKAIYIAWDTAFSNKDDADRSACVVWGEFENADDPTAKEQPDDPSERRKVSGIILMDAWAGRLNFPELKQKALELYKFWKPVDSLIIESKGTGPPLIQELRAVGLIVEEMGAHRGHDKVAKTNAVSDMFSSGAVWAPTGRKWAQELIEEMAAFPHGEYDDMHDAAVLGLLRIRRGGFRIPTDAEEEPWRPWPRREYY